MPESENPVLYGAPVSVTADVHVPAVTGPTETLSAGSPAAPAYPTVRTPVTRSGTLARKVPSASVRPDPTVTGVPPGGVTLTCTIGEKTAYLAEVQQAGVFGLVGFDDTTLEIMLGTHCPNALYPYVRQVISDLIQAGGFPPFVLQPLNFESLFAEGMRQRAEQQGLAGTETAGNA